MICKLLSSTSSASRGFNSSCGNISLCFYGGTSLVGSGFGLEVHLLGAASFTALIGSGSGTGSVSSL